jgi:putative transposase
MPRSARDFARGLCYHIINRSNARAEVFRKPEDFDAFLRIMGEAGVRMPMRLIAYCLLPNHCPLCYPALPEESRSSSTGRCTYR